MKKLDADLALETYYEDLASEEILGFKKPPTLAAMLPWVLPFAAALGSYLFILAVTRLPQGSVPSAMPPSWLAIESIEQAPPEPATFRHSLLFDIKRTPRWG